MKLLGSITILITIFIASNSFADTQGNYYKINGAQIFVMSDEYQDNVSRFFIEAKKRKVNTVFIRVFHNKADGVHLGLRNDCVNGGVYFKTDEACLVNDILPEMIAAAHDNDIKLYAWMATRSLSFLKSSNNMSEAFIPDGYIGIGYGANLFNPDVRKSLNTLFADLAAYDIDGILLQDDFIIKYNEGADIYAQRYYEFKVGEKLNIKTLFGGVKEYNGRKVFTGYTDKFYEWANFKMEYLMEVLKELIITTKSINPNIKMASNVYYETPIEPQNALAWYSQSLDGLLAAGSDYLAVMGYVEQIAQEKNITEQEATKLLHEIAANCVAKTGNANRVILKIQSRYFAKNKAMLPPSLFASVCRNTRDISGLSYAVVPINSIYDINHACFRN